MSLIRQVPFGRTGIKVSPIIVGCMSYGSKKYLPWCLEDEDKIFEILKYCYDHGIRTFDTANCYSNGKSERVLDEDLDPFNLIDDISDTPVGVQVANQRGLSRKHIFDSVKASMERLGTYIDVLQIHRLDHDTPYKEIMKALNDVVEAGYTRYIGASTMRATEFVELQMLADKYNWFQFVNLQTAYNLLYREDEREFVPFAKRHGIAMTPWSPNARGLLTRPVKETITDRYKLDKKIFPVDEVNIEIINRVEEVAKKRGVSMAMVSLSWLLGKGCYPIVGLNSIERVREAIESTKLQLTEEEIKYLEEPYRPRNIFFF